MPNQRVRALSVSLLLLSCNGNDTMMMPPPGICLNIDGTVSAGGLQIRKPRAEVNGCSGLDDPNDPELRTCMEQAPDLTCVGNAEPLGAPIMVTFTGCVASFGLDAQSNDLTVTLMRETTQDGSPVDPGYDLMGMAGQQAENTPDAFVQLGTMVSEEVDATVCPDRGRFTIANVPTETPMISRVTDQHIDRPQRQYVDTYQYNVLLRNSEIREGPDATSPLVADPQNFCMSNPCFVVDDVNTVFETTFTTVALTAGVSQIQGDDDLYDGSGQGHLAGEVQDCSNRDTVQNAVIALGSQARKIAYFNVGFPPSLGNLEDPKVDQSRDQTNADGLYAAIAVDTQDGGQAVEVGAAVTRSICGEDGVCRCADGAENPAYTGPDAMEGEVLVLGSRRVFIFPDSITILTFDRGIYTAE